ncbi:hypothetical protein BB560_001866 [Smittium megazygosporum]|uniref:Ribosomal RNA-processing protein 43 n=1 Tax=Smittium megazygosporum TaxID=133381 RepID=A0A2T9ZGB6_9FUNG|nr:hypothetical protein BB560_001866 [Smittium megazygosporum]
MSLSEAETKVFHKLHTLEFQRRFFAKDLRSDKRDFNSFRNTKISLGGVDTADGSATVRVGKTTVVCVPNIKLSPLCSANFLPGPPGNSAQSLSQMLHEIFNESVFSKKQLCIQSGSAVWVLYADIVCLNYDGNILDAAVISLVNAILNTKLCRATFDESTGAVTCDRTFKIPLSLSKSLYPATFNIIDSTNILADPSAEEEAFAATSFFIAIDNTDKLVRIWKRGCDPIPPDSFNQILKTAFERKKNLSLLYKI